MPLALPTHVRLYVLLLKRNHRQQDVVRHRLSMASTRSSSKRVQKFVSPDLYVATAQRPDKTENVDLKNLLQFRPSLQYSHKLNG